MAESKKKKTVKKAPADAKKSPSKTVAKSAPKTATKKTKKSVSVSTSKVASTPKVESTVTKKTAPKKSPSVSTPKASLKPKKTKKVVAQKKPTHFTKDLLPETTPSKDAPLDTSVFTMIVAIFIVVLVVFGGFIYARRARMMEPTPPIREAQRSQRISVSSSVILTPDVVSALEVLVTKVVIGPDEVLKNVQLITDLSTTQKFWEAKVGDYIFEFQTSSVLFRPSVREVISTSPNS